MTDDSSDTEQSFISHLIELRDRLLRVLIVVILAIVALFPFSNTLYNYLAIPLVAQGSNMIVTGVAAPFMVPFKLTLMVAVAITIPYTLYQLWSFVVPGLYPLERKLVRPLLVSSILLFYLGMAFAYFVVSPLIFGFFVAAAPQGVAVMTDISEYLDFVATLFFAFGVAFEIPIATVLLVWTGIITPEALAGKRPYIIVGAFVIGMFLTPPDAFSQTLLALPMWFLFEIGVFFAKYFVPVSQEAHNSTHQRATGTEDTRDTRDTIDTTSTTEPQTKHPLNAENTLAKNTLKDKNTIDIRNTIERPQLDADKSASLTDAQMETELDAAIMEEQQTLESGVTEGQSQDPITRKLEQVYALRQADAEAKARTLLYEILAEGNDHQRLVARNILKQLDS